AHATQHLTPVERERDPVDSADEPILGCEVDLEAVDLDQPIGHQAGRIRGSSHAYVRSTRVEKRTMKKAPKSVTPMIGGRSRRVTFWAAYWPTPFSWKTVSVRMAPPPIVAPKSRPKSVTPGISELRTTCLARTRLGVRPLALAVRT